MDTVPALDRQTDARFRPMQKYILDHAGQPLRCENRALWARWVMNTDRRVALDEIGDVTVSTWFRGFDHVVGDGPPLLWETVVIGGSQHGEMERYASHKDALLGHRVTVALIEAFGSGQ